ncbi:MAG: NADH:ubiquinone oxidoreductase [Bryobacteraceae bacterium]
MSKPTAGIFGLTGCAGDQLVILNCEDRLLDIAGALDIREFLMAASNGHASGPLDVALVDGAVVTARDEAMLREIRGRSGLLVALGTCAVWGGVAAMDGDRAALKQEIYGEAGAAYDASRARALREVVPVDLNIPGCPIEKEEFVQAVSMLLHGDPPAPPGYAVCAECRMRENNCLLLENGEVCCGPLTVAGCNARCPELHSPCIGCRGPASDVNLASALAMFEQRGIPRAEVARKLRTFAPMPAGGRS